MEKKEYYRRLDLIRIISCILVLFYHLNIFKGRLFSGMYFFYYEWLFSMHVSTKKRRVFNKKILHK